MFHFSVNCFVLVVSLCLSEYCVLGIPAHVIKKDAAKFDPPQPLPSPAPILQLDHFETEADDLHPLSISTIIDPLHHEESSPKSTRSISSFVNTNNNMPIPDNNAGNALLQALTNIQLVAQSSGINIQGDPTFPQSSVADVQMQMKKLKEQVGVYQMIGDMLKAEQMVQIQKEPIISKNISQPDKINKPHFIVSSTPQPQRHAQAQPTFIPISQKPQIVQPKKQQEIHQDVHHDEINHDGHFDYEHNDYPNTGYQNHNNNNHYNNQNNRDYDQYHNHNHQQPQQHYDYDHGNYHDNNHQFSQVDAVTQKPIIVQPHQQNTAPMNRRRKFKRNN